MNSPEALVKVQTTISEKWNGLMPRERVMLVGMVLIIIIAIITFSVNMKYKTIARQQAEIEKYRESLDYIAQNQATYLQNKAKQEAMRQKLMSADSKMINTKLTSIATTLGFDVDVNVNTKKAAEDSPIEEQEITVTIKSADHNKAIEYMVELSKLDAPIYMRHIKLNRTSGLNLTTTTVSATITLMAYRLKEQNAT